MFLTIFDQIEFVVNIIIDRLLVTKKKLLLYFKNQEHWYMRKHLTS